MKLLILFIIFYNDSVSASSLQEPLTTGYTCTPNLTTSPCRAYAFYRASAPDFLDLASVSDLFSLSRPMISNPTNLNSTTTPLIPDQPLFIPLTCSCNAVNSTQSFSYANLTYTITAGDTFYYVSTHRFQNLTTYPAVQVVNPTLLPTNLPIGVTAVFPIFCKCPNPTRNRSNFLVSYVFQPSDTIASIALRFNSSPNLIIEENGGNLRTFDTVFVPVERLPVLEQPINDNNLVIERRPERKSMVIGLGVGLGICGVLLGLLCGLFMYREMVWREKRGVGEIGGKSGKGKLGFRDLEGVSLMADVSDCLDKFKVFGIEELRSATDGFDDQRCLIHGSVYKGCINGDFFAIKKMKWDACDELKILQKVNHGNLVKLEGFCIDPKDLHCYLVYEYVENGSLHSLLHTNKPEKLSWKMRLRIAIDVANGLQYIHEHTVPRVVHKDIKSSNILLDSNMRAKIANFGLAKSGCNAITMHIVGTQGYIAPEYLSDGVVSTRTDVFSFGVVLLELVSGREAVDGNGNALWASISGVFDGKDEKKVKEWMDRFLLRDKSCSMESVMNVLSISIACLNKDPSRRPSMVDIVYALCKSDDDLFFDVSEGGLSPRQVMAR